MTDTTITVHRHRMRIEQPNAIAFATALTTGTPAVPGYAYTGQEYAAAELLTRQYLDRRHVSFPDLNTTIAGTMLDERDALNKVASFCAHSGQFYLEFWTFDYGDVTVHASASMWHDNAFIARTLALVPALTRSALRVTTRADHTTRVVNPSLADVIERKCGAAWLSEPEHPEALADDFDVRVIKGPGLTDDVWSQPDPEPGDDITYDTAYSGGVRAEYVLVPKQARSPRP